MRSVLSGLLACSLTCSLTALVIAGPALAQAAGEPRGRTRDWVADVVTRISATERGDPAPAASGTVGLRLRVAADGTLDGVAVEDGSGAPDLNERAIRAVRGAAPFRAPPVRLLSLEGYVELSFPLRIDARARRRSP